MNDDPFTNHTLEYRYKTIKRKAMFWHLNMLIWGKSCQMAGWFTVI